jgi:predicted 2-oxoglutarate/Fe(II)-dependent dioxygenase YbiX
MNEATEGWSAGSLRIDTLQTFVDTLRVSGTAVDVPYWQFWVRHASNWFRGLLMGERSGLGRGERAPDFVLPVADGTPTRFYSQAGGRPTVLVFGSDDSDALRALGARLPADVALVEVRRQAAEQDQASVPWPAFCDLQGRVRAAYRLGENQELVALVLNPNLRVLGTVFLAAAEAAADEITSIVAAALPPVEVREITTQAPVLLIPDVLSAELCEYLMKVWEDHGNVETGVEHSEGARRKETIDRDFKRRRDHTVQDRELVSRLATTIGRRVMPEVWRAFSFQATRFEGFKIVCYDAEEGGFFGAHRDNLSPSTAHRRFALTLNLNEGHQGGHLRFPEYGPHLYRPGTGGAVVFSGSLLHEVTPVTRGRRFTLLSFLFGQDDVTNRVQG